jgi:hypothetical protein
LLVQCKRFARTQQYHSFVTIEHSSQMSLATAEESSGAEAFPPPLRERACNGRSHAAGD